MSATKSRTARASTASKSRAPSRRPSSTSTSGTRMDDFEKCESSMKGRREAAGLGGVTYRHKLSTAQVEGLAGLLEGLGYKSPDEVLTYGACKAASVVLCRWPRPSELSRVLKYLGHEKCEYYHLKQSLSLVKGARWGAVVGSKGSNLIEITEGGNGHGELLYAWLHSAGDQATLHLYGRDEGDLESAAKAFERRWSGQVVVDGAADVRKRTLSDSTKEFGLSPDAKVFKPKPKPKTTLNPRAKSFVPAVGGAAAPKRKPAPKKKPVARKA